MREKDKDRNFAKQRSGHKGVDGINSARDRRRAVRWKDFRVVSLEKQRAVDGLNPPTTSIRVSERERLPFGRPYILNVPGTL